MNKKEFVTTVNQFVTKYGLDGLSDTYLGLDGAMVMLGFLYEVDHIDLYAYDAETWAMLCDQGEVESIIGVNGEIQFDVHFNDNITVHFTSNKVDDEDFNLEVNINVLNIPFTSASQTLRDYRKLNREEDKYKILFLEEMLKVNKNKTTH